jgi:hypothetical protein
MFFPYSSDVFPRHRPWMAYVLFPAFIILISILINQNYFPNSVFFNNDRLYGARIYSLYLGVRFLFLFFVIWLWFVMWTLGRALCTRIGNLLYVLFLAIFALMGLVAGLFWTEGDPLIWLPSWIICGIGGMCLMFLPDNSVECFFIIPPWRRFTTTALWIYVSCLIVDVLVCLVLGWNAALLLHPMAFVLGFLCGWLLSKVGLVVDDADSYTFWQWVKGGTLSDSAWEDSWSVRKKQKAAADNDEDGDPPVPRPKRNRKPDTKPAETIGVLCNCGEVLNAPLAAQGKRVRCPACSNVLRIPETPR